MVNPLARVAGVFCACLAVVSSTPAQEPIRVNVQEVIVPVTVTGDRGKFVANLEKKDFKLYDEGKPQTIEYFSREHNQSVVVGFLIDLSNANRSGWKDFQEAAEEMVLTLLPGDPKYSGYLIGYGSDAEVMVDTTSDADSIVNRIKKLKPGGGSALYDAIFQACTNRKLVPGEPNEPRRVIIIIGDGHDNASKKTLDEVIELAQREQVTIYGVSTVADFPNGAEDTLVRLANETGGKVEYPRQNMYSDISGYLQVPRDGGNFAYDLGTGGYANAKATKLFSAIADLSGEITLQYVLRFVPDIPPNSKKVRRELKVTVELPDVHVRARPAYFPNQ
ncbi:MAG TPA: VWA domain-containing protein [Bryobacteraceae bacterium]|jgi:VWFA-related protein